LMSKGGYKAYLKINNRSGKSLACFISPQPQFATTQANKTLLSVGYKKVCLECKICLNRPFDNGSEREYPCSVSGKPMKLLSHLFKPPKKTNSKHWETVKYLVENCFHYQHIYKTIEKKNGVIISREGYVSYPENLKDAKEFVKKYKEQLPCQSKKKANS
jgi:hypothetical protein